MLFYSNECYKKGLDSGGLYKMMVALTTSTFYFVSKLYLSDFCPIFEIAYFSFWQNPFFILAYSFQCKYHLPLSLPFFFNFHFFLWSQKRKRKRKKKKKKNGCHVLLESWFIKFRQSGALSKSKKAYFKQQYKKMAEKNLSLKNFLF